MNPKRCVEAAKAFDGIAVLLAQYLHANQRGATDIPVIESQDQNGHIRYKVRSVLFDSLKCLAFLMLNIARI